MLGRQIGRYQKMLKEVLKDHIEPLFQENSFFRAGDLFFKVEPGMVKVVDWEFFRFNTQVAFFYWFNLTMYCGNFQIETNVTKKLLLTQGTPVFSEPLGWLWNDANHMYQITDATNQLELAEAMKRDLNHSLFPFWEKIRSMDDTIQFLLEQNKQLGVNQYSYILGIALAKAGKKAASRQLLLESPVSREIIEKTARAYGIELDELTQ
jgi:hypothetical protein